VRKLHERAILDQKKRKEMENELRQYSKWAIEQFEKVFPVEKNTYDPQTMEWKYYHQNIIPKEGGRENIVNITLPNVHDIETRYNFFWERWNRYKQLIAFL
jgi:hypothetical protein